MIKYFILFFVFKTFLSQSQDVKEIRSLYFNVTNKSSFNKFLNATNEKKIANNPIVKAYHGLAIMMQSNYILNPITKLTNFEKGKNILESLIMENSSNLELRFIRFCIQNKAPAFLGYNKNKIEDKKILLFELKNLKDKDLQDKIKLILNYE